MVKVYTSANGAEAHEPPYTEEEEYWLYKSMGPPVGMTSVTRGSNATPPPQPAATVPKKKDRPGR